jgi:hypothetical protein
VLHGVIQPCYLRRVRERVNVLLADFNRSAGKEERRYRDRKAEQENFVLVGNRPLTGLREFPARMRNEGTAGLLLSLLGKGLWQQTSKKRSGIDRARSRFEHWRETRSRMTAIPEELWSMAINVARREGVNWTAQQLHLDAAKY